MIDKYLETYGTVENYLRVYGGQVEFPEPKFDTHGRLSIAFSRPVVFPAALIAEYNSDYIELLPELRPTDEELAQINEDFKQFESDVDNRDDLIRVQTTREVCELVERVVSISTSSSSSASGSLGRNDDMMPGPGPKG